METKIVLLERRMDSPGLFLLRPDRDDLVQIYVDDVDGERFIEEVLLDRADEMFKRLTTGGVF